MKIHPISVIRVPSSDPWAHHMRSGNWPEAWQFSDQVLIERKGIPCWHLPRHYQYIWDGTPLNNKRVLIRCYHGLGDTIQFIRYLPLIKSIAKEVIVWAQPALIPLLQTAQGIDHIFPLHDGTPEVEYDVDIETMELPHIFRTTLQTIPFTIPYLHVHPAQLPSTNKLKVGLVWQGGDWNVQRSMPFSTLAPLAELTYIDYYILQANPEAAGWDRSFGTHIPNNTLYKDAQLIKGLDLLISVDTMPAHLAGALGVPVWTLLNTEHDWRWMDNRNDSPWYPTMRLFRQPSKGEWDSVIQQIRNELTSM